MKNKMLAIAPKILFDVLKLPYNTPCVVKQLLGGMSNFVVQIIVDSKKYVIRIPYDESHLYVEFAQEKKALELLQNLDITSQVLYFNPHSGIRITHYIDGVVLSEFPDFKDHLNLLVDSLKILHAVPCELKVYGYKKRLAKYEKLVKQDLDDAFYGIKKWWLGEYEETFKNTELVFSHGDIQRSNLVYTARDIKLLDFEFSARNSVFYDLASFGNINFDDSIALTEAYFGHEITDEELYTLRFYRLYQVLQWYVVATSKHEQGLDKNLNLDFSLIAKKYLEKAKVLYGLLTK